MFSALSQFVFGASSLFSSSHEKSTDGIKTSTWKDKKLCFDLRSHELELTRGEQLIACFYPIEDVKGNQDEPGLLRVTNLRLQWICCKKKRVNLSIGWRTVTLTYEQNLKDTLCLNSTSLFVLSKYESTKYEFVFTKMGQQVNSDIWSCLGEAPAGGAAGSRADWRALAQLRKFAKDRNSPAAHLSPMYLDDPFDVVFKVWQSYKQTHLFRHARSNLTYLVGLNSSPLANDEEDNDESGGKSSGPAGVPTSLHLSDINRLPSEEIIEVFSSIGQNESRVVKYSGSLVLTNIRLIWVDEAIYMRNLSIPYIRIDSIKLRQGERIQVNTYDYLASSTHVEFQALRGGASATNSNSNKATKLIFEQIQNLYLLYKSKPRYGPESCEENLIFMSNLRPIEQYFEAVDKSMLKALENFGPEAQAAKLSYGEKANSKDSENIRKILTGTLVARDDDDDDDDDVERAENDLSGYTTKLVNYLNEQPLELDNELIYSADLGLAMEKPASGANINSIWRIEV